MRLWNLWQWIDGHIFQRDRKCPPHPRRGEPLWFAAFFCAKCGFTVRVGLTCRFGRCWTRPTGAQHRSSPRKVTLGSAARLQAPSLTPRCRYQLFAVEGHCSLGLYFVTLTQGLHPRQVANLTLWGSRFFLPAFFIDIYFITLTQGLHPKQFAIITSVVVATFFARVFTSLELGDRTIFDPQSLPH